MRGQVRINVAASTCYHLKVDSRGAEKPVRGARGVHRNWRILLFMTVVMYGGVKSDGRYTRQLTSARESAAIVIAIPVVDVCGYFACVYRSVGVCEFSHVYAEKFVYEIRMFVCKYGAKIELRSVRRFVNATVNRVVSCAAANGLIRMDDRINDVMMSGWFGRYRGSFSVLKIGKFCFIFRDFFK